MRDAVTIIACIAFAELTGFLIGWHRGFLAAAPVIRPKVRIATPVEVQYGDHEVWIAAPTDALAAEILIRASGAPQGKQ